MVPRRTMKRFLREKSMMLLSMASSGGSEPYPPESEGVGDDRDGAEAHGGGGEHGAEEQAEEGVEDAGCNGDAEGVVDEGEEQVLTDVAHSGVAEADGFGDAAQVAFDKGDAGAFDRDVGAGAHGD